MLPRVDAAFLVLRVDNERDWVLIDERCGSSTCMSSTLSTLSADEPGVLPYVSDDPPYDADALAMSGRADVHVLVDPVAIRDGKSDRADVDASQRVRTA